MNIIEAVLSLFLVSTPANAEVVNASWYHEGTRTANGEHYKPDGLTAAHKKLPFGTKLLVKYNGREVVVRVNDRGPYIKGRTLDLSRGAARALGFIPRGVGKVDMQVVSR